MRDKTMAVPRRPAVRLLAGSAAVLLALAACDGAPAGPGTQSSAPAMPMDPTAVAGSATTAVDPAWLCSADSDDGAPEHDAGPGVLTPATVQADGTSVTVTGPFALEDGYSYGGFLPEGVLLPASPDNRGAPAPEYDVDLTAEGAPAPPLVVRERVEVPGTGSAPSAATAQLSVGTCDDAPLPDGQYLLSLSGGGVQGPGRGEHGWASSEDVLLDVVDGELETVPGAVTAPDGEAPVDLSGLACGAPLAPLGDGDGLRVEVDDPSTSLPAEAPEGTLGASVTAEVAVTSTDRGTRALLQGIAVTDPSSGAVLAGARSASEIPLQWIGEEGVSTSEIAWTTRSTCSRAELEPGAYRAFAFAATVDATGGTHLVLSDPWEVEVGAEEPSS